MVDKKEQKERINVKSQVKNPIGSGKGTDTRSDRSKTTGTQLNSNVFDIKALNDIWQDFSQSLTTNLNEIIRENQEEYTKLYNTWTDLSTKFGQNMAKNVNDNNKEYTELYNIWKNYTNKLTTRLAKIGNNGGIDYEMLLKNIENYTKKMNIELFGESQENNIKAIYNLWENFYKNMTTQMDEIIQSGKVVNNDLNTTWTDFSARMGELMTKMTTDSVEMKELNKDWENISSELNKSITNFITKYQGDIAKFQDTWMKQTSKIGETLNETFEMLTESYGEIYNKYFERTASYFMNLDEFSNSRVKKLEKEVVELKARFAKLEAKLQK